MEAEGDSVTEVVFVLEILYLSDWKPVDYIRQQIHTKDIYDVLLAIYCQELCFFIYLLVHYPVRVRLNNLPCLRPDIVDRYLADIDSGTLLLKV